MAYTLIISDDAIKVIQFFWVCINIIVSLVLVIGLIEDWLKDKFDLGLTIIVLYIVISLVTFSIWVLP